MHQASGRPAATTAHADHHAAAKDPPIVSAMCTLVCGLFGLLGWWLRGNPAAAAPMMIIAYLGGGAQPAVRAIREVLRGRPEVDLLMIVAALGAAALGDALEGAVLLFLFSLSNTLEAYALYRTTRSIDALVKLRPHDALLVTGGNESRVPVESLVLGDVVRVVPGERFPIDGVVAEGESWVDEATITGESEPVHKAAGGAVFAGTMNGKGSVLVAMTRVPADSAIERIVALVEAAQNRKTATQTSIESWERPYVCGVFIAAGLTFVGAWQLHAQGLYDALYHAMVLLVAASPCAVVIGAPAVMLSAIARGAMQGVLFKGGRQLELTGQVEVMAFDKTGTLTLGRPTVEAIWTTGIDENELLRLAAAVERGSEHHLAAAVVGEANRRDIQIPSTTEFESHTGRGVHAHVEGHWVGLGREDLFESHGVPLPAGLLDAARRFRDSGRTALLLVVQGRRAGGVMALADQVRPEAARAIAALRQLGIRRTLLLTGDHEQIARNVAAQVQVDDVLYDLLPEQKVLELNRLMNAGDALAMVGDGVNDAPALATASVGIAMGGAGTDVALEVADVVLMRDDLSALPLAVWLSRRAARRVRQNMGLAFGMIVVLVLSSFLGLPLWLGVIGHEGSTVVVVFNGLRLLWEKPPAWSRA